MTTHSLYLVLPANRIGSDFGCYPTCQACLVQIDRAMIARIRQVAQLIEADYQTTPSHPIEWIHLSQPDIAFLERDNNPSRLPSLFSRGSMGWSYEMRRSDINPCPPVDLADDMHLEDDTFFVVPNSAGQPVADAASVEDECIWVAFDRFYFGGTGRYDGCRIESDCLPLAALDLIEAALDKPNFIGPINVLDA